MSWIDTSYEKEMRTYFIEKLGETKGEELYTDYSSVRNAMERDNFFREIKGVEPNLSDHSERHIQDVFERAFKIIGKEEFRNFDVYEIYCLALMILFHDVGNIYGRKNHEAQHRIAEVYNKYRNNIQNYRDERRAVSIGASAHSGKSKSDNGDTLKDISDTSIKGNKIRLQELSAILRFSDELAEGKQRTCSFLIDKDLYDNESNIYHKYAEITNIGIDRNLNRISITYDINISKDFDLDKQKEFKELLIFTYYRAVKLDIERRYTKYYSDVLKKFLYVTVQYNFNIDEIPIDIELKKVVFEDKYPIPGEEFVKSEDDAERIFTSKDEDYGLDNIINSILKKI